MKVDIIAVQRIDFTNDQGQRILGTNLWYLDPERHDGFVDGTLPIKKWITGEICKSFMENGTYEVELDLRGRVVSGKFIK